VIIIGLVTGGNLGHFMSLAVGVIFLSAGLVMMAVLQTKLNFLNFSMSTVIVSLIFGLLFLTTGFYDKVSTPQDAVAEERFRRNRQPMKR
ncbi:MAG TPA: DUF4383 domain-containing protein, partial [Micromonosporaceae bacterium]|nr:DUF4383 domain-containing protein [Micromonosporaceae bacterium]